MKNKSHRLSYDLFVDRSWSTYFFQDPIPQPDDLGGPLLKADATSAAVATGAGAAGAS